MKRLISAVLCCTAFAMHGNRVCGAPVRQTLHEGWKVAQSSGEAGMKVWYPAQIPGTVHTDLMAADVIPDPFFGTNELQMQWIDKEDWVYRTTFDVPKSTLKKDHHKLVFEGLDTYADVFLNGKKILSADNMFRTWKVDVRGLLKSKENELEVVFYSPIKRALPLWEATPWRDIIESGNDQAVRGGLKREQKLGVYERKAGYHFGWDWGPRLVTSGIWRPVYIESWDGGEKIDDVFFRQMEVTTARAEVEVTVETAMEDCEIVIKNGSQILARGGSRTQKFVIENPNLWWCHGMGEPYLYDFEVELRDAKGRVVDTYYQRLGLRSIRIVTEPDRWGESFYVELNGVPVFMKGANYIPQDPFLPRVTKEQYENTVRDALLSNMNMLRVWGGGVYEDDYFYDLCDEHGILVWQDFMFACALYPAEGEFLENIRQEARDNVRRLRNHTCMALWCGNNECLDMWFHWGVKRRYDRTNPEWSAIQWRQFTDLYYKTLPEVVEELHPGIAYRKSSPYSDDYGLRSDSIGDYHDWDVWGQGLEFDLFNTKKSRFFSEYGFQGFPSLETIKKFAPDPADWSPTSEVMLSHQRAGTNGNQKIEAMMERDYGTPRDFEAFTYMSQLMQADAMRIAMEAHRRQMPRCMGSLIWQMNDCWPVASWSGRDWYGNWKAQQYAIRRAFDDILLSPVVEDGELRVYAVSDRMEAVRGILTVGSSSKEIEIPAQSSSVVWRGEVPSQVIHIALDGQYDNYFYPRKHKDMGYEKPHIEVGISGDEVTVSSDKFARGVCLIVDGVIFSDNFFDLRAGQSRTVKILAGELKSAPRVITYADCLL